MEPSDDRDPAEVANGAVMAIGLAHGCTNAEDRGARDRTYEIVASLS